MAKGNLLNAMTWTGQTWNKMYDRDIRSESGATEQ